LQHGAGANDCRRGRQAANRERECLVGERTRIVNRIKSTVARLGIRNFKPTLRKAAERLATVHTPEGIPLPPNALAELQRDRSKSILG
jgi:transposase